MKALLTLVFVTGVLLPSGVLAQAKTQKDSLDLIAHTWGLTSMEFKGKTKAQPPDNMPILDFKRNGTIVLPDPETPELVHWSLTPKTRFLVLDKPYKILKLTETTLILADMEDEGKMYLTRL